jgi:hypothetical protein
MNMLGKTPTVMIKRYMCITCVSQNLTIKNIEI